MRHTSPDLLRSALQYLPLGDLRIAASKCDNTIICIYLYTYYFTYSFVCVCIGHQELLRGCFLTAQIIWANSLGAKQHKRMRCATYWALIPGSHKDLLHHGQASPAPGPSACTGGRPAVPQTSERIEEWEAWRSNAFASSRQNLCRYECYNKQNVPRIAPSHSGIHPKQSQIGCTRTVPGRTFEARRAARALHAFAECPLGSCRWTPPKAAIVTESYMSSSMP